MAWHTTDTGAADCSGALEACCLDMGDCPCKERVEGDLEGSAGGGDVVFGILIVAVYQ
jgi:hypothetical protein